jgi:hypothetical protein
MTTLHIEHPISDYRTWRKAFDTFEPLRTHAGAVAARVHQPIDDDHYIVIQLDFTDEPDAIAFLDILRHHIWTRPDTAPALDGEPRTLLLTSPPTTR